MKRKEAWILMGVLVITCMLLGSFSTSVAGPVPTGELRVAIDRLGSQTMDPILGPSGNKPIYTMFYDYLFGVDTKGNLSTKTGVATDWKLAPDAMTLTVHVRSGIRFHNGDELTSADVKFSIEQFTSKRAISSNAGFLRSTIKDVEAPDPRTVIIHFKKPCGVLPNYLSRQMNQEGSVMPKKYMEEKGVEYFNTHPVGSGPYRFLSQLMGNNIKYQAVDYPHWLIGIPKFKYFTYNIVKEESTRISMLKTGATDIAVISRDKIKEVTPDFKVYEKKGASVVGLFINNTWDKSTLMSNEKFREALDLSIDREELKEYVFNRAGVITGSGTCYGSYALGYKPVPLVPYDPARAKKLVQEVMRESFPGEKPFVNIYEFVQTGVPETAVLAQALASYFKKIGVDSKIIPQDYSVYRKEMSKKEPNLKNSIGVKVLPNRLLWDGAFRILYHSKGHISMARDPKLDALIDAAASEKDPGIKGQKTYEVALYMREHHYQLPIIEAGNIVACDPKKVPAWPHIGLPYSYDYYFDDIYTR